MNNLLDVIQSWRNKLDKKLHKIKRFLQETGENWRKLRIWSHLLEKSLMENFIFYAVEKLHISFAKNSTKLFK